MIGNLIPSSWFDSPTKFDFVPVQIQVNRILVLVLPDGDIRFTFVRGCSVNHNSSTVSTEAEIKKNLIKYTQIHI